VPGPVFAARSLPSRTGPLVWSDVRIALSTRGDCIAQWGHPEPDPVVRTPTGRQSVLCLDQGPLGHGADCLGDVFGVLDPAEQR
jgi:hypothetical protein